MQTLPQSWGIRQEGAVPLTQAEMHTLFSSIHQMLSKTTDQAQQLLLVRDGLLLSILWQACYRASMQQVSGWNTLCYLLPLT